MNLKSHLKEKYLTKIPVIQWSSTFYIPISFRDPIIEALQPYRDPDPMIEEHFFIEYCPILL